jgi:hypothetical protein
VTVRHCLLPWVFHLAPAGGRVTNHQRVGPKEEIKRGQIKLTEAEIALALTCGLGANGKTSNRLETEP